MRVLIVEDQIDMLPVIETAVREEFVSPEFPNVDIMTAQCKQDAETYLARGMWDLVSMDLQIPDRSRGVSLSEFGLELLERIMKENPTQNLIVFTGNHISLNQLKAEIDRHEGGFSICDKIDGSAAAHPYMRQAYNGEHNTKHIRTGVEMKPQWLAVLKLIAQGKKDDAIAKELNYTPSNVRQYIKTIKDRFEIYSDPDINPRARIIYEARRRGFV
jgi:DNA-binding NarL/FixJ family response regulator